MKMFPGSVTVAMKRRGAHETRKSIGAVVLGGEFHGLGIVRSLGRHGVPVCVIDDEHSISSFSHYATHAVRVPDLHDPAKAAESVLEVGRRMRLDGWVLFPMRDELFAAMSRYRAELSAFYRVPTPEWSCTQWAWDKRKTYQLAESLGIAAPRTWYPKDAGELAAIDVESPLAIKPAIKEHFFYATGAKAWRAGSRAELEQRFSEAAGLLPPGEVMVQDVIPGDGRQQYAYCAFFKDGEAVGSMVARRRRQHPPEFG